MADLFAGLIGGSRFKPKSAKGCDDADDTTSTAHFAEDPQKVMYTYDPRAEQVTRAPEFDEAGPNMRSCSLGYDHAAAVTAQGQVLCVGDNTYGQLGIGSTQKHFGPIPANMPWPAVKVSSGNVFSVALKKGGKAIVSWGWDNTGRLGRGRLPVYHAPPAEVTGLPPDDPIKVMEAGYDYVLLALESGEVWGWGYNGNGTLALGKGANRVHGVPIRIPALSKRGVVAIGCGERFAVAETENGEVLSWGWLGGQHDALPVPLLPACGAYAFPLRHLAAGGRCVAAADGSGCLWVVVADSRVPSRAQFPDGQRTVRVGVANAGGKAVVALTGDGHLWDCRNPKCCRNISVRHPWLPRFMLPYGGSMGERIVLAPDLSAGKDRLRLLLLAAARRVLFPSDVYMKSQVLIPFCIGEAYIFEDCPEKMRRKVAERALKREQDNAMRLHMQTNAAEAEAAQALARRVRAEEERDAAVAAFKAERARTVTAAKAKKATDAITEGLQRVSKHQLDAIKRVHQLLQYRESPAAIADALKAAQRGLAPPPEPDAGATAAGAAGSG
eukprot:TRINITY_DN1659_c0_g4_i1.p1 TRINITY_DN1659_c0_g4~~TRINITY_DN1659_c0_g4_i1.p1  ORF type:complete len:555 (+),score=174.87 TRINITY_DN1659_c0_g4_i1:78-1742(+)